MKKIKLLTSVILSASAVLSLVGCGEKADAKTITVGASSTPHAEILEQVKASLASQGYTLNIVVYDDYILPNKALSDKTLDANYFQHTPYLNSYNASNGTDLVSTFLVHYEPFGIYGNEITSLSSLASGATILIPADDSNETRALFLLQQEGLITLKAGSTVEKGVTTLDIADAKGYNIQAVQADLVTAQLRNSDKGSIAVVNGNYALQAGLKVRNALAVEDASGEAAQTYANVIATRKDNKDDAKIKALINVLNSEAVKKYINDSYDGAVLPIFKQVG